MTVITEKNIIEYVKDANKDEKLIARVFAPKDNISSVVVIASAMGASQSTYKALAQWLCESLNCAVVTFDYRGMYKSSAGSLKHNKLNITDWATKDCQAVIDFCVQVFGEKDMTWIGHSLGGQVFGLIPNNHHVKKLITIAAGTGYWRHQALKVRPKMLWFWFAIQPMFTLFAGYFPGKRFNIVGDLPRNVIWQWRRWCMRADYLLDGNDETTSLYQKLSHPIDVLYFSDDELISEKNVKQLHQFYQGASKTFHLIEPSKHQLNKIGHFGYFKAANSQTLWQQTLADLFSQDTKRRAQHG
ncbi:alpha/beta hydrolase family protein [Thalassotalea agarivorans]|uniref:Predicted alpha/beta hydrolase n=1 Tax=Thalassotalea agarivorans TaxID=349064 RepID=A0A1I0AYQ6_THASX|nr:alpha/beta fold hydrolase [Thalassotalea agarivorans]SES98933.1 Predicted alpha/beta hydrolase [Thalassotalea agarivorans]